MHVLCQVVVTNYKPPFHYFRDRKYHGRPLNEKELQYFADHLSDIDEDIVDFTDDSVDEDEIIEENNYDSESEQSGDENCVSTEEVQMEEGDFQFYIGKDEETIWKSSPVCSNHKTKAKNIIKVFPGAKGATKKASNPLESFLTFITTEMIDSIVTCTNIYLENKRSNINYQRDRDCKSTTSTEIRALFGALYIIAVKKGNRVNVKELWSADGTGMMLLRAAFSYKRFLFLLRAIRFDNINTRKDREKIDKLAAVRDIYSCFVNNCRNNYSLGEFITIDEMLHPFRGRCSFIQYMPQKPAKYGLKIYALCDSRTHYTWNFEIYCGKQHDGPYQISNKPLEIVKRLTEPLKNSHRNVTTDNYYTSYPLAEYLLQNGLTLIGTLKKNYVDFKTKLV